MKNFKYISILILLFATSIATAQIKFEAKASKTKLGVNERLRIDFEMNKDGDNFNPPDFEGFTVVGGPNTSVSNSWINGVRSYSKIYSLIFLIENTVVAPRIPLPGNPGFGGLLFDSFST